jgi:hypothetical protein
VKTLYRDTNLGCKSAVNEAISWFFTNEEEGVILEDDCLPDLTFFPFCQELLERYRSDKTVMAIGANNFLGKDLLGSISESYFFSRQVEIWGWATWRRAWELYDPTMKDWNMRRNSTWLFEIGNDNKDFADYWEANFDAVYAGKIDTWDLQWVFSVWANNGFTILPTVNLVSNIGFNGNATHTIVHNDLFAEIPLDKMSFPLKHPNNIIINKKLDSMIDSHIVKVIKPFYLRFFYSIYHSIFK